MADEVKESVAGVFDRAAATYDQTGVEFFGPVGRHLVDLTAPRPGERVQAFRAISQLAFGPTMSVAEIRQRMRRMLDDIEVIGQDTSEKALTLVAVAGARFGIVVRRREGELLVCLAKPLQPRQLVEVDHTSVELRGVGEVLLDLPQEVRVPPVPHHHPHRPVVRLVERVETPG